MFTVFISASTELKALRDTIHDTLMAAGVHSITQDRSLGASPRGVRDLLARDVEFSDIVIHIAGESYGADAELAFPEHPEFRCSWTQFEYYYAHQLGKDVFAFVMAPTAQATNENLEDPSKRALQAAHRQRVVSGKFDHTPVNKALRTLNDQREVRNDFEMLSRLAGVVRRGQQDWGGRKDLISKNLTALTDQMSELKQIGERQTQILGDLHQVAKEELSRTRRRGLFFAAMLSLVLVPVILIALGGGVVEYGCRLAVLEGICREQGWSKSSEEKAMQATAEYLSELTGDPKPADFSVTATGSWNNAYLHVNGLSPGSVGKIYYQLNDLQPEPLNGDSIEAKSVDKFLLLEKMESGELTEFADFTEMIHQSLTDSTYSLFQSYATAGIPMWECSIGGCFVSTHTRAEWLCNSAVQKVETKQDGSDAWFTLDRSICQSGVEDYFCIGYRSLPFAIDPAKDFMVRFTFADGRQSVHSISTRVDRNRNAGTKDVEHWVAAVPIKDKNPDARAPNLLVQFQEGASFVLKSGLDACATQPDSGRWFVDSDGKGLLLVQEYQRPTFGPAAQTGYEFSIPRNSELGKRIAKGTVEVGIAWESEDGVRTPTYWYAFDARAAVIRAAALKRAGLPGKRPEITCITPYDEPAFCRPVNEFEWLGYQSIEFGLSPDKLEASLPINLSVEDFLEARCEGGRQCKTFNYALPSGVDDVLYRTTDEHGNRSEIARVNLAGRNAVAPVPSSSQAQGRTRRTWNNPN